MLGFFEYSALDGIIRRKLLSGKWSCDCFAAPASFLYGAVAGSFRRLLRKEGFSVPHNIYHLAEFTQRWSRWAIYVRRGLVPLRRDDRYDP